MAAIVARQPYATGPSQPNQTSPAIYLSHGAPLVRRLLSRYPIAVVLKDHVIAYQLTLPFS
jgi:hypothetical protein